MGLKASEVFFWATHGGAELDLFAHLKGRPYGFEFRRADAPRLTPSMRAELARLPASTEPADDVSDEPVAHD